MASGHGLGDSLYVPGDSRVHRLAPHGKVLATVLFVFAVVSTRREAMGAYAIHALILVVVIRLAGLRVTSVLRRLVVELPFIAFAFFLPIIGRGERIDVLGVSLSQAGLWAAWNIVAKGTLGVAASVILASTTSVSDLLAGLERLRVPRSLVAICGFMIRYIDVISGEMHRMKVARQSRGYDPRWIWQNRALAASAGSLFIRSYERGERVYLAMASRGYTGHMPSLTEERSSSWAPALLLPLAAALVSVAAWVIR